MFLFLRSEIQRCNSSSVFNINHIMQRYYVTKHVLCVLTNKCNIKGCVNGTYGYGCNNNCTGHCLNDSPCNKTTGHCDRGCKPGYTNSDCSKGNLYMPKFISHSYLLVIQRNICSFFTAKFI